MKPAVTIFGFSAWIAVTLTAGGQSSNSPPANASTLEHGELRLNFRAAPLESILNYLSEAAGFVIDLRTPVKGTTTVWSNQPVTQEEALALLSSALDQNGYAAVRHGRTLTIYTRDEAKRRDVPVKTGNQAEAISRTDELITQIVPVRYISAVQVAKDLQSLLPETATMTANEGSNALLITDTQANIRRFVTILNALDTAVASVSRVRVFPLRFADAKALASVVKDLFQPQESARSGGQNQAAANVVNTFQNAGPGANVPAAGSGGAMPGSTQAGNSATSAARGPLSKVVAVAEERSNSLVVSAPEDQMLVIERLIEQVDINVQDITQVRVFRLLNADAEETAELLTELFADVNSSNNSQGNRGTMQFGGSFAGIATGSVGSGQSGRYQKQIQVVAVADLRTRSVVVSAGRDLMLQIEKMIAELDSSRAKKQEVFVFNVQNGDPQAVQDILGSLFPAPTSGTSASTRQSSRQQNGVGNQLNNRATQNQNQRSGQSTGNSGFGSAGAGQGGGTGTGGR